MANSSRVAAPTKPRADFPLFPHKNGQWAKKVLNKLRYFGRIADDPEGVAAHQRWLEQRDDLYAGRTPRPKREGLDLRTLCNHFMAAKEHQLEADEIRQRTYDDYFATAKLILDSFGKDRLVDDLDAQDFQSLRKSLAKTRNATSLGNMVQRIRTVFKYGYDAHLIASPVRFGPLFKRPAKKVLRREKQEKGKRLFEARHLRRLLKVATPPMRAMILLGLNGGFGNFDCGSLPKSAVDLDTEWIDYARPKTSIDRRIPLWPETIAALRLAMETRPTPKSKADGKLVFITKHGRPWASDKPDSPISKQFRKMLIALRLYRPGLSFYTLRHTFETIAGGCKDQIAVDAIMGHVDGTMAAEYREEIADVRLRDAVNHVRKWLFRRESAAPWRAGQGKAVAR